MHALSTKYNILYNGYLALEAGKEELATTYQDNYWEILPVERLQEKEEITLPGQQNSTNFGKAEEKATKAIQKHSMDIGGKERNYQIDEAFVLLGEARYYEGRMIPALEAFNYVIQKYPTSSKIIEARIWREKVNIRLDYNEIGLKNLRDMLRKYEVELQELADARAMMAAAYINLKHYDSAVTSLKIAAEYTKNNEEKGRYNYILGQLYNTLEQPAMANAAFNRVIDLNRKSPRVYMINAYLQRSRNFDWEKGNKAALRELLEDLADNRENRPYLDIIYHELGNFYKHMNDEEMARKYYNKSLAKKSFDKYLNAMNYSNMAEMAFNRVDYKTAGKYYDSTLQNLYENTKLYRAIAKKRKNLDDVIYYEDIAKHNDSILSIVAMSDIQREQYFSKVIDSIVAKEKADKAKQAKEALAAGNKKNNSGGNSNFYFYNQVSVDFGRREFEKKWGKRKLEDDWRLSDKGTLSDAAVADVNKVQNDSLAGGGDEKTVDFYLKQIPTDSIVLDSISGLRNYAYYQLGLIYYAKFKEYPLAANRLEFLLQHEPSENLELPAKYNLYKIYNEMGDTRAYGIKQDIIGNYPESRYAILLQNPYAELTNDKNSPSMVMSFYHQAFNNQEYWMILELIDDDIARFNGEPVMPKLEMMKAVTLGRLEGIAAYKEALSFVSLNYPASEEGKQATKLLKTSLVALEKEQFKKPIDTIPTKMKWVYVITQQNKDSLFGFQDAIKVKQDSLPAYADLSFSTDVYNRDTVFFVIHGFESEKMLEDFTKMLKEEEIEVPENGFFITSGNYSILQTHKNLKTYLEQFNKPNLP